jgi:hypothetical protein
MAEHRDEQAVGVARVDDDVRNLLAVAQAEMGPRLAGVGRLVDAVADREIRPRQPFAAADVDRCSDPTARRRSIRSSRSVDRRRSASTCGRSRSSSTRRRSRRHVEHVLAPGTPVIAFVRPPRNGPIGRQRIAVPNVLTSAFVRPASAQLERERRTTMRSGRMRTIVSPRSPMDSAGSIFALGCFKVLTRQFVHYRDQPIGLR